MVILLTFLDADQALAGSGGAAFGPIFPVERGALGVTISDVRNASSMDIEFRGEWTEVSYQPGTFGFEDVVIRDEVANRFGVGIGQRDKLFQRDVLLDDGWQERTRRELAAAHSRLSSSC